MDLTQAFDNFMEAFDNDEYIKSQGYIITSFFRGTTKAHIFFNFPMCCVLKDLIQINFYGCNINYHERPFGVILEK